MADTPIITAIMNRIDLIISGISEIAQVQTYPHIPTDRASARYPFTGLRFDIDEVVSRNRLEVTVILFTAATIFKCSSSKEDINAKAFLLEALIHKALYSDTALNKLIQLKERVPTVVEYETETDGIITQQYRLTFLHKYGDPFTKTNY